LYIFTEAAVTDSKLPPLHVASRLIHSWNGEYMTKH